MDSWHDALQNKQALPTLANEKHNAAAVQHELTEDVAGYGTKWKRLIAVIYDCGAIQDPEQMRADNQKHFGATVLIVKH